MGVVLFYTTYNTKKIACISRKCDNHGARGGRFETAHRRKDRVLYTAQISKRLPAFQGNATTTEPVEADKQKDRALYKANERRHTQVFRASLTK